MLSEPAKVLFASVDVTPADLAAVRTAGYSDSLPAPHGVLSSLEANVLGLAGGELPNPVYVLSVDSLYGGVLGPTVARELGCDPESVVVLASHTHFAPSADPALPRLGRFDRDYVQVAATRIADAVRAATWRVGVRVRYGSSNVRELFVNRRRPILGLGVRIPRLGRVVTAPEPTAAVDRTLRLCEWVGADGDLLAMGWGVGCHPVCTPDRNSISADFPGAVRDRLRGRSGSVPVLFFQAGSADVRPASTSRRPPVSAKGLVRYLLAGMRTFVPQSPEAFDAWCSALVECVQRAQGAVADVGELSPRLRRVTADVAGVWVRKPQVSLLELTGALALLVVNAEVPSSWSAELNRDGYGSTIIPATCADEVFGYWPTSKMLAEGGYEGCRSRPYFPAVDWRDVDPDALWRTSLEQVRGHGA